MEHDHYIIADLGSQNGTWIAGERIDSAPLTEGVEVALGPYCLVLDPERAEALEDGGRLPLRSPGRASDGHPRRGRTRRGPQQAATMLPQPFPSDVLPRSGERLAAPPAGTADAPGLAPEVLLAPNGRPKRNGTSTKKLAAVAAVAVVLVLAAGGIRFVLQRRDTAVPVEATPPKDARRNCRTRSRRPARRWPRRSVGCGPAACRGRTGAGSGEHRSRRSAHTDRRGAGRHGPEEPGVEQAEAHTRRRRAAETPAVAVAEAAPSSDPATGLTRQKRESARAFARRVADAKSSEGPCRPPSTRGA